MIFSSLLFIYLFLPLSLALYYFAPKKWGNAILLILSIIFCGMYGLNCLVLVTVFTAVNFLLGLACGKFSKRKLISVLVLTLGIAVDLSVFLLFRTEFFAGLSPLGGLADIIIPVGISFFTLSGLGYLIDIFRGRVAAECNIFRFALYIFFFPKFYMGPLVSYAHFSKKLTKRSRGLSEIGAGITVFVKGLAKKVILADNLYQLYSAVRAIDVGKLSALSAWLGVLAYMLCIYFSLSGFSDMGIGISRCFGFRFARSFNYPTFSMGIRDFCSRWHKTPVKWFRGYITLREPEKISVKVINIFLFLLAWGALGLWYDFTLNKFLWGMIIGVAAIIEGLLPNRALKATAIVYTFIITSLSWVMFFGEDIGYSLRYYLALVGGNNNIADSASFYLLRMYLVILLISAYAATDLFRNLFERSKKKLMRKVVAILSPAYITLLLLICTSLISYSGSSEMMLPIL